MRILMTTTGYPGHALPMVPFARALIKAGFEVRIVGPQSRGHFLTRLGLPYVGIYESPEAAIRRISISTFDMPFERANGRLVATGFGNLEVRAALPSVLATIDSWRPGLVIRESYEFAAIIATELRGLPLCCVSTGLDDTERWILAQVSGRLAELRGDHGLSLSTNANRSFAPFLSLMPECLEDPRLPPAVEKWRFSDTSPIEQPRLDQDWAAPGAPLLYVSFGTLAAEVGLFPAFYRAAAWSLANLPLRVVMTVGEKHSPSDLGPLPDNVRAERWIPQDSLLAQAVLMVSHPGYGAMMGALARGVPMVVMPLFTDDHLRNAARIAATGVGVVLPALPDLRTLLSTGAAVLSANLTGAVKRVLADASFRSAATRVAGQFAALPPIDEFPARAFELQRI
jgi:UDP-N-acetylglucosamine:LPS N-acetylglucosamine transferase